MWSSPLYLVANFQVSIFSNQITVVYNWFCSVLFSNANNFSCIVVAYFVFQKFLVFFLFFGYFWWRLFNNFHSFVGFISVLFLPDLISCRTHFAAFWFRAVFTIKGSTLSLRHANRHMNGAFYCIGMIWLIPNILHKIHLLCFIHSIQSISFHSWYLSFKWCAANHFEKNYALRQL